MKHLNLRMDDGLHARLAHAAERDRRSLNSMVLVLIEQGLRKQGSSDFTPALKDGAPAESN